MAVTEAVPIAARAVVVAGAAVVVLAAGTAPVAPLLVLVVGVLAALARPATVGAWVALPAAAWTFAAGNATGTGPALLAAAGAYLVHTGVAFAAVVPWHSRVTAGVVRRWALRCLPAVVLTLVVAGFDAVLGRTPRSSLFAVAAGAGVLAAGGLLVWRATGLGDPGH